MNHSHSGEKASQMISFEERNLEAAGCKDPDFTRAALPAQPLMKAQRRPGTLAKGFLLPPSNGAKAPPSSAFLPQALWQPGAFTLRCPHWEAFSEGHCLLIPLACSLFVPTPSSHLIPVSLQRVLPWPNVLSVFMPRCCCRHLGSNMGKTHIDPFVKTWE